MVLGQIGQMIPVFGFLKESHWLVFDIWWTFTSLHRGLPKLWSQFHNLQELGPRNIETTI